MAWDLKIDPATGDLTWDTNLDLAAVSGIEILRQRISTRLKIELGSFIYNTDLGSRVRSIFQMGIPNTDQNLEMLVRDALEPMDDIIVTDIAITHPDPRVSQVSIYYQPVTAVGTSFMTPVEQATVLFPT